MIRFISLDQRKINMLSGDKKRLTGAQLRAARAIVRWSAEQLAAAANIGVATVRRAEAEDGELTGTIANESAMRAALEGAGIEFIFENGGGPGVRLRRQ